jgi:hypothetical protein
MEFLPPWDVCSEDGLEPVEFHDVVQWLRVSHNMLLAVLKPFSGIT